MHDEKEYYLANAPTGYPEGLNKQAMIDKIPELLTKMFEGTTQIPIFAKPLKSTDSEAYTIARLVLEAGPDFSWGLLFEAINISVKGNDSDYMFELMNRAARLAKAEYEPLIDYILRRYDFQLEELVMG